jgi:hypothetical protein
LPSPRLASPRLLLPSTPRPLFAAPGWSSSCAGTRNAILHTTTNILAVPELAAQCRVPFTPANPATGTPARVECCTSDITLDQFKSLCGKMDGFNPAGTAAAQYMAAHRTSARTCTRRAIDRDGDTYELLHVLAKDVGIRGIFSDWPATVSCYASCFGL